MFWNVLFSLDHCDDLILPLSFPGSAPTPSHSPFVHICYKVLIQKGLAPPILLVPPLSPNLRARFVLTFCCHWALFTLSNLFFHPISLLSGCGKYSFPGLLVLLRLICWFPPSKSWFSLELGDRSLHTIGVDMELSMTRKPKDHTVYQAAFPFSEARTIGSQEGSWMGFSGVHELLGIICNLCLCAFLWAWTG